MQSSFLGRRVNRDTQQQFLDLICSFLSRKYVVHSWKRVQVSVIMKVTVRKNLYLGAVWVQRFHDNRYVGRQRLTMLHWKLPEPSFVLRQLCAAMMFAEGEEETVLVDAIRKITPPRELAWLHH